MQVENIRYTGICCVQGRVRRRRAAFFNFPFVMKIVRAFLLPPKRKPREAPPVAAPVPRPFDFGFTERRPLVPLPAVVMFLGRAADEGVELIEGGQLRWAVDICTAKAAPPEGRGPRQNLFS